MALRKILERDVVGGKGMVRKRAMVGSQRTAAGNSRGSHVYHHTFMIVLSGFEQERRKASGTPGPSPNQLARYLTHRCCSPFFCFPVSSTILFRNLLPSSYFPPFPCSISRTGRQKIKRSVLPPPPSPPPNLIVTFDSVSPVFRV